MPKTAVALRHVHFEDLGAFEAPLTAAGYKVYYYDIGVHELWTLDPVKTDLVLVLGGPVGVYESANYPFLEEELDFLRIRLVADRPTFGICLGAQLMAAALGAQVRASGVKEIGFAPLTLTGPGKESALARIEGLPVLHWHGDMFDIPPDAVRLAETGACPNQAFALGRNIMGVQFHPEADTASGFERWLIGHAVEIAAAGIDPRKLRSDAQMHGARLRDCGRAMFAQWLEGIET